MDNILITGASSGIGRAVAAKLLAQGKSVFVHGRSATKLEESFAGCPQWAGDLVPPGAAAELISRAAAELGQLDAVVHCVGVGLIKPAAETTDAEFSRVLNVNTRVTFLVAQAAAKVMAEQKQGLFLTIPGILGRAVMKNAAAYIASKFAVTGLIKAMAQEYQRAGVRFSLLHLGGVDSPFWDDLGLKVQRDKMIPVDTAADLIVQALQLPPHLVLNELVLQPDSHQL
jgi:NAD(P)-dependent dehydrogenase (short-subunit alcohol dehydrogenase family)